MNAGACGELLWGHGSHCWLPTGSANRPPAAYLINGAREEPGSARGCCRSLAVPKDSASGTPHSTATCSAQGTNALVTTGLLKAKE